jgi:CBS domain-containing protein
MSALVQALTARAPFSLLGEVAQTRLAGGLSQMQVAAGDLVVPYGTPLGGLYFLQSGVCDIVAPGGAVVSHRVAGDILGERGLLRDGYAAADVRAIEASDLITLSADLFHQFMADEPAFAEWFRRSAPAWSEEAETGYATGLTALHVRDLMSAPPITCDTDSSITDVAKVMRDRRISSLLVMRGDVLQGIVTTTDLTNKVLAEGRDGTTPVTDVMTRNPVTIRPDDVGLDAMMLLASHAHSRIAVPTGDGGHASEPHLPPDHRYHRCDHAPVAGLGRGRVRPAAGALSVAGLRLAGAARTDGAIGSGQLPDPVRRHAPRG